MSCFKIDKARFFLLVDLQDFFSDLGSGTRKKALKIFRAFLFSQK